MTPQSLAALRSRLSACDLAVYVDIGSRTVLASDGALRYPQEFLDALCFCAAEMFNAGTGAQFDVGPVEHVFFRSPTGTRAFFRAPNEGSEALCCILGPEADLTEVTTSCQAILAGEAA